MKTILLVVAHEGYQPIEYGHTRKELEDAGFTVKVCSNKPGVAQSKPSPAHGNVCDDPGCYKVGEKYPQYATASVDVIVADAKPDLFDGIFIIGGPGAMECLDNQPTIKLMQAFARTGKPFGAICISPRILATAGLLSGKNATGWDGDERLNGAYQQHNVTNINEPVVVDGNIVTADGPRAAMAFGKAIVELLQK